MRIVHRNIFQAALKSGIRVRQPLLARIIDQIRQSAIAVKRLAEHYSGFGNHFLLQP